MRSKTVFNVLVVLLVSLIFAMGSSLPESAIAEERTGDILREIMGRIDDKVKDLESKTDWIEKNKTGMMKEMKGSHQLYKREKDDVKREKIYVDLLLLNAKINKVELEEVHTYLSTIGGLLPDLKRLRYELNHNMGFQGLKEDFKVYRGKMEGYLTNAAYVLKGLKQTAPTTYM